MSEGKHLNWHEVEQRYLTYHCGWDNVVNELLTNGPLGNSK